MHLPNELDDTDGFESDARPDSLRLWMSDQQWLSLLERIARSGMEYDGLNRRATRQRRHPKTMRCVLRLGYPGKTPGTYVVRSRNISSEGLGFIHGGPIAPGTRCALALETDDGAGVIVSSRVAWCKSIDMDVYDIGMQFDKAIDINRFISQPPPPNAPG
jgi:hypothetical protein